MAVYDKGKYHDESVRQERLPRRHADHHIVFFLRWLIENDLVGPAMTEGRDGRDLSKYQRGRRSIFWLFGRWDRWFVSDMVAPDARPFVDAYVDYDRGAYLADYKEILVGDLPSIFAVRYNDANYRPLAERISQRWRQYLSDAL